MMEIVKDYLFQLALITVQILVYHIFFAKKKWGKPFTTSFLCGISIILCMSFPADTVTAVDIRIVPLLIGTLYGGIGTGLFLSVLIILYRMFIEPIDTGFYNTVLALMTSMPVILYFQERFERSRKNQRVRFAVLLSVLYCAAGVSWFFILTGTSRIHEFQIIHIVFTVLVVWFIVSMNEMIKEINQKNQELESDADRMQLINNLTSAFAHEIRNPMQVTRGFLQLLNGPDLPDTKREYIRYSIEELDRANGIINDLLAFGRPNTNDGSRIEVTSELSRVVNILQTLAMTRNVEIDTAFREEYWILANPQKLHQAIINILKNAIESMPSGGKVLITCGLDNRGRIEISVKDEGIGMTQEQIAKMGSPYYSLKEGGTGLGMMVTYRIIRNMQGTIRINSKMGFGTEFLIYLPQFKEENYR